MGFRTGAYATVWQVEPKSDRATKVRISISKKNRDSGEYEQDFSGYVSFVGTANAAAALKLREKDRIKLGDVDVTTFYKADTKTTYTNYACFNFEVVDGNSKGAGSGTTSSAGANVQQTIDSVDDGEVLSDGELPF